MRLKLVLIASLIAAIAGAGTAVAVSLAAFASLKPLTNPGVLAFLTYLLPLLTTLLASIFVYRHTARRRKLQAALTALVTLSLSIGILVCASIVTARADPAQPQPVLPRNVG
jgi:hypothetical protein